MSASIAWWPNSKQYPLDVKLQGPNEDISVLPNNTAVALFHICQESLANIAKHAHARHVDVAVWTTNDRILLEIRYDGVGFNSDKVKINIGHGLSNIETRALNAGGEVDITSETGKGTSILAWVPLPEENPASSIVAPLLHIKDAHDLLSFR